MVKLADIKAFPDCKLWLKFDDGLEGTVDLSHLVGQGVFKIWEDKEIFTAAHIDMESGAIAWAEQVDICPDSLYLQLSGRSLDDLQKQFDLTYAHS